MRQTTGGPSAGQLASSPVSEDTAFREGPRHCGQADALHTEKLRPDACERRFDRALRRLIALSVFGLELQLLEGTAIYLAV